jgi:peptidoglycan/xylan/chitin deacetylase (PgdA/CDA1 family)
MNGRLIVVGHGFVHSDSASPIRTPIRAFLDWLDRSQAEGAAFAPADSIMGLSTLDRAELQDATANRPQVVLTFDDALASIDEIVDAVPVPGAIFVVADFVGKRNDWPSQPNWVPRETCLSWSRLRSLADHGWTIGAHTCTHPRLDRLGSQAQREEIERSQRTIEDRLGHACDLFAYPYGDAPASARSVVASQRMTGLGTRPGIADGRSDIACLPRVDLFDLTRPGIAADWAWRRPSQARLAALHVKRVLGRFRPRAMAA